MTTNKTYTPILIDSVLAAADLQQKRFVGFDGNCCTAGAKALGVVDVTTEKGQYAPVAVLGVALLLSGMRLHPMEKVEPLKLLIQQLQTDMQKMQELKVKKSELYEEYSYGLLHDRRY